VCVISTWGEAWIRVSAGKARRLVDAHADVQSAETEHLRAALRLCQQELAHVRAEQETWAEELTTVKAQRGKARRRAAQLAEQVRQLEAAQAGGRGRLRHRLAGGRFGQAWRRLRGRRR
jgi:chromosome segregation ATPase